MGIEKLEPTVPRKDVERRIQVLRKEQIRNTALRFRFQMILQRYNTYQTHWLRICRADRERHVQAPRGCVRSSASASVVGGERRVPPSPSPAQVPRRPTCAAQLAELDGVRAGAAVRAALGRRGSSSQSLELEPLEIRRQRDPRPCGLQPPPDPRPSGVAPR